MSKGDPNNRPRLVRQGALFGGVDVLSLYGERGRIRTNARHCRTEAEAHSFVRGGRALEGAELVELPDTPTASATCPKCGRIGRLDSDFGTRVLRGRRVPQSWCRPCRSARTNPSDPA